MYYKHSSSIKMRIEPSYSYLLQHMGTKQTCLLSNNTSFLIKTEQNIKSKRILHPKSWHIVKICVFRENQKYISIDNFIYEVCKRHCE